MSQGYVDAFFTVTEADDKVGFVVQGGRTARFGWGPDEMLDNDAIDLKKRWPNLPAAFADGFDATFVPHGDDPWTVVFRGNQCLRLHPLNGYVAQVSAISEQYPGLPTEFGTGIDAALPAGASRQVFFLRGDQCVHYDLDAYQKIGVSALADTWRELADKAPEFTSGISAAAVNLTTGKAYFFQGTQYVRINLATRTVETNATPVDDDSWRGLVRAFTPGRVYVARGDQHTEIEHRYFDDHVHVVDLTSHTIAETFRLPIASSAMHSMSATPDGRFLYVVGRNRLQCMDTSTHTIIAEESLSAVQPPGWAYSPDGTHCYFARRPHHSATFLGTVQTGGFTQVSEIPLTSFLRAGATASQADLAQGRAAQFEPDGQLGVRKDGRFVYVSGATAGTAAIAEVDLEEQIVRQFFSLPWGNPANVVAVSPDGSVVHVASNGVTAALSTNTGEILARDVLPPCGAMALTPDGSALYCLPVTRIGEGVLVADPETHQLLRRIPIGMVSGRGTGRGLAFSPGGAYAYVAEASTEGGFSLAVIDTEARDKVVSIPLPPYQYGVSHVGPIHWVTYAPV